MKQLFILSLVILLSISATAQSPFHKLAKPSKNYGVSIGSSSEITAYRFTGPVAGYMYPQNQIVTGLGYGLQRLHFVDSTQKYYTDFSVSAMIFAGGNVNPSLEKHNIISTGISIGILNQLINVGGVYNFSTPSQKGSFGLVVNFSVPLNN